MKEAEAFPLAWPAGRPRTEAKKRERADFARVKTIANTNYLGQPTGGSYQRRERLTIEQARQRVSDELRRLGAKLPVISTNLRVRQDGFPMSNQREPVDPGVAIYFVVDGSRKCIAIDRWDRVADNLAAVAKSIEALRGLERWGGGQMVSAAFSGFKELPPPGAQTPSVTSIPMATVEDAAAFVESAANIGGLMTLASAILAKPSAYKDAARAAAKAFHPDRHAQRELPEWHALQRAKSLLDAHHNV